MTCITLEGINTRMQCNASSSFGTVKSYSITLPTITDDFFDQKKCVLWILCLWEIYVFVVVTGMGQRIRRKVTFPRSTVHYARGRTVNILENKNML